MLSTMGTDQLTITSILRHGELVHSRSRFSTYDGSGVTHRSYAEIAARSGRLAAALRSLGIGRGDRVATLCWNHVEHLEAYFFFAVPCMGSVLLTLNLRLGASQLRQIACHAAPKALIADESLLETASTFLESTPSIETVIVCGEGSSAVALPERGLRWRR
jgi:acyl-CoA synthetase (AMP-forming)/AMP-acid ligase II